MLPAIFVHTHRVTYAECTIGDHIYYARYLDLLEAARGEFFRHLGVTLRQLTEGDTLFPVIEACVSYKGAARYDDVLRIELWLTELERVRLNFAYRVVNEQGRILVEAKTRHACTTAREKPKRVPAAVVARLEPYICESMAG